MIEAEVQQVRPAAGNPFRVPSSLVSAQEGHDAAEKSTSTEFRSLSNHQVGTLRSLRDSILNRHLHPEGSVPIDVVPPSNPVTISTSTPYLGMRARDGAHDISVLPWRNTSIVEAKFVSEEFLRCRLRVLVANFFILVAALACKGHLVDDRLQDIVTAFTAVSGAAVVFTGALVLIDEKFRRDEAQVNARLLSVNKPARYIRNWSSDRSAVAYAHEAVCFIVVVVQCLCAVYYASQTQEKCLFDLHFDDDHQNDVQCPRRINQLAFLMTIIPLLVGQPRFVLLCFINVSALVVTLLVVRLHHTSRMGQAIAIALWVAHLSFMASLKFVNEGQLRDCLAVKIRLMKQREDVEQSNEALKRFVLSITPHHLRPRLRNPAGAIHMDSNSAAICVMVEVRNALQFLHSMLPTKSATRMAMFLHACASRCANFGVHHIRSLGDACVLVANLFDNHGDLDLPTGSSSHSYATLDDVAQNAVRFAMMVGSLDNELDVVSGVAKGWLIGLPLGTSCIRYDVFGEALNKAMALATSCEAGHVHVDASIELDSRFPIPISMARAGTSLFENTATGKLIESRPIDPVEPTSTANVSIVAGSASMGDFDPLDVLHGKPTQPVAAAEAEASAEELPDKRLLESYCCCLQTFASPHLNVHAEQYRQFVNKGSMALVFGTMAVLVFLVSLAVVEERFKTLDVPLYIFFVVNSACCSVLVWIVVVVNLSVDPAGGNKQQPCLFRYQLSGVLTMLVVLGASHLSRRSIIGDDPGFLLYMICLAVMYTGADTRLVLIAQALAFLLYMVPLFLFRPVVSRPQLVVPSVVLLFQLSAIFNNRRAAKHTVDLVEYQDAVAEVEAHTRIRQAVYAALVPTPLQTLVQDYNATTPANGHNLMETWDNDDVVVLHITMENANTASSSPQDVRAFAENTTTQVEQFVTGCTNETLHIVKLFGGTIVVAGPLRNPRHRATSARRFQSTIEAVSDAMEVVDRLLSSSTPLTAAISLGQASMVLQRAEFPSFELMGSAVSTAKALASAAPGKMILATERFTRVFQQECKPNHDGGNVYDIRVGAAETWRLRGVGMVRVSMLSH